MPLIFSEKELQEMFAGVSWIGISGNGSCCPVGSQDLIGLCFLTVLGATGRSGEQQARGLQRLSELFGSSSSLFFLPVPLLSISARFSFSRFLSFSVK